MFNANSEPVGIPEMIAYSLGNGAYNLVMLGIFVYLTYFWTDIAMVPVGALGSIFLISRILDGGTDLLVGFLVDRTETKFGKARPWLLWMALPGMISLILLFYAPNLTNTGKVIYAFVTYNLVAFFVLTALTLPYQSLTSLITGDSKKRVTLNLLGATVGVGIFIVSNMLVVPSIAALGGGAGGYFKFFTIIAVIATGMFLITFAGTKERVNRSVDKQAEKITLGVALKAFTANKWWMIVSILVVLMNIYPAFEAGVIYYMTYVVKDQALMGVFMSTMYTAMVIALIVATPIVPRIGKIKAGFLGMFLLIIGALLPQLSPSSVPVLMVSAVLRGTGPSILVGTRLAFMCDVIEYGEWKTGVRIEGLVFSGSSMGGKLGAGIGGALVAVLLARGGYIGGAPEQSQLAISAIKFIFTWGTAIIGGCMTLCLFLLQGLDKKMPQIMFDLQKKRNLIN